MAVYHEDIVDIDLNGASLFRSFASNPIGLGDINGHRYGVHVLRNDTVVNLTGVSCVGYFIRSGHADTVTINGTVNAGNGIAYVTLSQACYAYEGAFSLVIKLVGGGVTGTMRIVDGMVVKTTTGNIIDPGHVVPTLTELLAQIDQMRIATDAANNAASNAESKVEAAQTAAQNAQTAAQNAETSANAWKSAWRYDADGDVVVTIPD